MLPPQKILVVDDEPVTVELFERVLVKRGYQVQKAYNGLECIEKVRSFKPDLILLDIIMPEMDGIATCERLKEDPASANIPVIFITARTGKKQRLQGLALGAVDYITKPLDMAETVARVRTQLGLQQMHRENLALQLRMQDVRREAVIGAVTQGIAHNLNNLLGVVVGYVELLQAHPEDPERVKRMAGTIGKATQRIVQIVKQLNAMAEQGPIAHASTNIHSLLQEACETFTQEASMPTEFIIEEDIPASVQVLTHPETVKQSLNQLFANAWESYTEETKGPRKIWVRTRTLSSEENPPNGIGIEIRDAGVGIPAEIKDAIFEPFVSSKAHVGRGLGLTLVKHGLRHHHGDVSVEPYAKGGTIATVRLPLERDASQKN
ncbi:MAG: hypothetical protein B7X06_00230 [Verrucomicrobia bacterium 21-51-4]|nr:MAG: hypothetical protein B7X06_00230 [Verrucomicrobia bacterium 21-51-4]HQU08894.1 hybrid sensor histidine kinase/response regulator [Opitutales bacterium]